MKGQATLRPAAKSNRRAESAILYVSETYDVEMRTLGKCLDVLDFAGYSRDDLKPRLLR